MSGARRKISLPWPAVAALAAALAAGAGCGPTGAFSTRFSAESYSTHGNIPFDGDGAPRILSPSLGAPRFARPEETLQVQFAWPPNGSDLEAREASLTLSRRVRTADGSFAELAYSLLPAATALRRAGSAAVLEISAEIAPEIPGGCYDLRVNVGKMSALAPLSVRVFRGDLDSFRFVQLTDLQLQDPRFDADKFDSALRGASAADALFALVTGDLVFGGSNYEGEYEQFVRQWRSKADFCSFFVPGNHDLYYQTQKRSIVENFVKKASSFLDLFLSPIRALGELFMGSELAETLDGKDVYLRRIGPLNFSAELGELRLVLVNTYGGSPSRRSSIPPTFVQTLLEKLRIPPVDNWGGELSAADLEWLAAELADGRASDKTIVVAGHHDPRGTAQPDGSFLYLRDDPFNTRPFDQQPFENWNYDSTHENPTRNSGTELVRLLSEKADLYLSGHTHVDAVGEIRDPRAGRGLPIVATVSAGPDPPAGEQGFRIFSYSDGKIDWTPSFPAQSLKVKQAGGVAAVENSSTADFPFLFETMTPIAECGAVSAEFEADAGLPPKAAPAAGGAYYRFDLNESSCLILERGVAGAGKKVSSPRRTN